MPALDVPPTNPDGSLRLYTTDEFEQMKVRHVGVADGAHPTGVRRPGEKTYDAEFFCAYAELDPFVCHMLGCAKVYDDGGVSRLSRMLPQLYPGTNVYYATSIEHISGYRYTGVQETDGRPIYEAWRVGIKYQHVPALLLPDDGEFSYEYQRYLQELPSTVAPDYISLPGGILKFQKDGGGGPTGNVIQYNVGYINTAITIRKKWLRVPYDAWKEGSALRARVFGDIEGGTEPYLGTINRDTVFGYAPGQLLFTGIEEQLLLDPVLDEQFWELTPQWLARSVSHNWLRFFDPSSGASEWCFVSNDGNYYTTNATPDGKSLFNTRRHRNLFNVDAVEI